MKKKVVFLVRDLNYGGAQRQLVTLVKNIDKELFDVTLLYFYVGGLLLQDLQNTDCRVVCLEKTGRWDILGFFFRLLDQLKISQPDILHGYLGESNIVSILVKPFFPSTQIIWGIRASNMPIDQYGLVGRTLAQLEIFLSAFTDLIIVNSHCGRDHCLSQGYAAAKMVVISNGIDTEKFQPDLLTGAKVRAEWGVAETTTLVGLVGRLDPMKDHPTFLTAAAQLASTRQDLQFVCVGVGSAEYAAELVQLAQDLGIADRVIWAGGRSDMSAVFNALNLVCSASAYGEGFPNIIGEAMACGVPCVVTDVGDSAWIVGDLGSVVPPQNAEALKIALAKSIEQSIQFDRANSAEIRQRIIDRFSTGQLVATTQATLLGSLDNLE
jgi:glycosyltransferase involved in cell wall biosynthesis